MADQDIWAALAAGTGASGLYGLMAANAAEKPDAFAFRFGDDVWTRGRFAAEVERVARRLLGLGLRPGDRLVFHLKNGPELAIGYFACFATGIIAVPLKPEWKTAELAALLRRLTPAFYIGHRDLHERIARLDEGILRVDRRLVVGSPGDFQAWSLDGAGGPALPATVDLDAPAVLLGTSGTTAEPKFVTHSQATLAHAMHMTAAIVPDGEVTLAIANPMTHMSGFFTTVRCLTLGAGFVLIERYDPELILDVVERHRCTFVLGMAYMFGELIEAQKRRPRDVSSAKVFISTGDVVSIELQQRFKAAFGTRLLSVWGATEVVGAVTAGPVDGPVSTPVPGLDFRLADDDGEPVVPGQVGELLLRGPNIAIGYWTGPGQVESGRRNGWFPTGDLMRQDADGNLWFVSRKKEMIIRGGVNVSPVEVELVLMSHPAVRDAAVIGIPDAVLGQRVRALVQLADGHGNDNFPGIIDHVSERLADYKVPETLQAVESIPRNTLGKVDRRAASALGRG
ncbi:class I adenylate-forming enzyme family protein [Inquilinus sp.]|jgi:long-chain acyl-CoA synthetase|uniref:class I adenylate-forming enzyme family protein n=1 Tax=Inquilinus sp. TaxID=1932117 RepID=UPI003783388A